MSRLDVIEQAGAFWYLVSPNRTTFKHHWETPDYNNDAVPLIGFCYVLEVLIRFFQGKRVRLNASISSIAITILWDAIAFTSSVFFIVAYEWLFQYRLFDLPWDSVFTWIAAMIAVDFFYYWIHRSNHEVNILWAAHAVHHSSEEYNLAMGGRLSIFQYVSYFTLYIPLALVGFTTSAVLVHGGLNLLYQFWLHTDLWKETGPLGHIFMNPAIHRVHHGANKWCLDKNYGSVLVIWDKMFGTFEPARSDEGEDEIVFGLTDQPQSLDPLYHQIFYYKHIYDKAQKMDNWRDKLKAVFYGPGWSPGSPRLGDPETFPDIKAPRKEYDPPLPFWTAMYLGFHFLPMVASQQVVSNNLQEYSYMGIVAFLAMIFLLMASYGAILDNKWWAPLLEATRCALSCTYFGSMHPVLIGFSIIDSSLFTYYSISMMIWTAKSIHVMTPRLKSILKVTKLE